MIKFDSSRDLHSWQDAALGKGFTLLSETILKKGKIL